MEKVFYLGYSNAPRLCGWSCCRFRGRRRDDCSRSSRSRSSSDGAAPPGSPLPSPPRRRLRRISRLPSSFVLFRSGGFSSPPIPAPPPQLLLPLERRPAQRAERRVPRPAQQRRVAGATGGVAAGEEDGVGRRDVDLEADRALDRRRRRGGKKRGRQSGGSVALLLLLLLLLSLEGAVGPRLSRRRRRRRRLLLGSSSRLRPRLRERLDGERHEGDGGGRAAAAPSSSSSSSPPVVVAAGARAVAAEVVLVFRLRPVAALAPPPRASGLCKLLLGGAVADHADKGAGLFWRVNFFEYRE